MRERCSHGAMGRLEHPASKTQTPHRGMATTFTTWPLQKRHLLPAGLGFSRLILMSALWSLATTSKLNAYPEEDAKTVAVLDTKYQAAVKANDATTMDQILADDFVLVTGRGKVYNKADLLDSARKKEVAYER